MNFIGHINKDRIIGDWRKDACEWTTSTGKRKSGKARARNNARKRLRQIIRDKGNSKCYDCGGSMSWCSFCEVWTQDCCVDYGTCQCS